MDNLRIPDNGQARCPQRTKLIQFFTSNVTDKHETAPIYKRKSRSCYLRSSIYIHDRAVKE